MYKKNIVLIGFMGTGKTTVGKVLAQSLNWSFIDTDDYIEEKYRIKISEIFNSYGEDYFRSIEKKSIEELYDVDRSIISTGGGIVLNEKNIDNLKKSGTVYLLDGSLETIISNLKLSRGKRPLLSEKSWIKTVKILLSKRKSLYHASADFIIDINNKSVEDIANNILKIHQD